MTTLDTASTDTTPANAATADALVERLFGAVLATMDLHAVHLGDRLGYYRALASGPADLGRTGSADGPPPSATPASGWSSRPSPGSS